MPRRTDPGWFTFFKFKSVILYFISFHTLKSFGHLQAPNITTRTQYRIWGQETHPLKMTGYAGRWCTLVTSSTLQFELGFQIIGSHISGLTWPVVSMIFFQTHQLWFSPILQTWYFFFWTWTWRQATCFVFLLTDQAVVVAVVRWVAVHQCLDVRWDVDVAWSYHGSFGWCQMGVCFGGSHPTSHCNRHQ